MRLARQMGQFPTYDPCFRVFIIAYAVDVMYGDQTGADLHLPPFGPEGGAHVDGPEGRGNEDGPQGGAPEHDLEGAAPEEALEGATPEDLAAPEEVPQGGAHVHAADEGGHDFGRAIHEVVEIPDESDDDTSTDESSDSSTGPSGNGADGNASDAEVSTVTSDSAT